jgi:hypothetical protein
MSYNLMAEGDLDLFELSHGAAQFEPLELFPIPAERSTTSDLDPHRTALAPDALGIAIPSSRSGPEAVAALKALVEFMWAKQARVFDLYSGQEIATPADVDELSARILGE